MYQTARDELECGRKRAHWIWYIFPQLKDLGYSPNAKHYSIAHLDEAIAYLANDTLRTRLHECCALLLTHHGRRDIHHIMGSPDDLKLRSCMTLFHAASHPDEDTISSQVLAAFYDNQHDPRTLQLLSPR
jgi:uncharacterized protein (DUF1810 family)